MNGVQRTADLGVDPLAVTGWQSEVVGHGVVAQGVASVSDLSHQVGVSRRVSPHYAERGLDVVFVQDTEHLWRVGGGGAVVERQGHRRGLATGGLDHTASVAVWQRRSVPGARVGKGVGTSLATGVAEGSALGGGALVASSTISTALTSAAVTTIGFQEADTVVTSSHRRARPSRASGSRLLTGWTVVWEARLTQQLGRHWRSTMASRNTCWMSAGLSTR